MITLFLATPVLFAQAQDQAKAKEILNKVSAKYKSYNTFKADFTYTLEMQADNVKETQKGSLNVRRDKEPGKEKFRLELGDMLLISDGKTFWSYQKETNEVTISNYDPKDLGFNPADIFTIYEKGYLSAYMGDETVNGKSCNIVELTPQDKKQNVFKVKLYTDKKTNEIVRSKIFEKSGNIYTIDINGFNPNIKTADTDFTFDTSKYKGVTVVDTRTKKK